MRALAFCLFAVLLAAPLAAQDNLTNVPDPDPALQQAALRVADGFEISLFASDPMIDPPIQMSWDERGRLWVATSTSYPQPMPGQAPNDKIFVLEDLDADGQADRSTLFAGGLLTPTGILVGDGGVYVANSTEIIHLKDTDGDGRADARRVVLSGFGADDTHHLIHSFRWGPDGRFYFNQSVYIYSHVETPWGVRRLRGGGIWRFDPATLHLDVLARGLWNPWGFDFDIWGQSFATDGAGFQGLHFIFPGVAYAPAYGVDRVLEGLNPGHPKYAGLTFLYGRHFPEAWQGHLITSDYRANRIKRFILTEDASGYRADEQDDLVWTDHVAFRPVDVNVGPDNALYLADWYNPIIQHGEVDFRDPRRDHRHGRIWRITAKDRPPMTPPSLHEATVDELLAALQLPEDWPRRQARRLLKERGAEAVRPALDAWGRGLTAPRDRLEALWLYQALGVVNEPLLREMLASGDHRVRAAAVRVLSYWHDQIPGAEALLAEAVADAHPPVRREAVTALGRRRTAEAALPALSTLDHPRDRFLDYALWHTLRELSPYWIPRIENDLHFLGDERAKVVFALKSVEDPVALGHLTKLYRQGQVPAADTPEVLEVLATRGGASSLQTIFILALDGKSVGQNELLDHLQALETAARDHDAQPAEGRERIAALLDAEADSVRSLAAQLAGRWKVTSLRNRLQDLAEDDGQSDLVRQSALKGLALLGDDESRHYLTALTRSDRPMTLRLWATAHLLPIDAAAAAQTLAQLLQDAPPRAGAASVFEAFFGQQGGVEALAEAVRAQPIPVAFAQAGLDKVQNRGTRFGDLREAFVASGAVPAPSRMALDLNFYARQRLEHDVKASGDAARGEVIYRRESLLCARCHAIGGAGGGVGPDLSSIGVTAPTDYLIESMLQPEKAVKDGYAMVRITRNDGSLVSGILAQETRSALIVRDAADAVITVPLSQVQSREVVPGSLMPAGLMAQLDREEFVDLVAFLSALGDDEVYRVPRAPHARRWRVLTDTDDARARLQRDGPAFAADAIDLDWKPAFSTTNGALPLADVPALPAANGDSVSIVQFDLDVEQAGVVAFHFDAPEGLSIWVDSNTLDAAQSPMPVDLPVGVHRVTLAIDRAKRDAAPVFVGLAEEATTARVRFVVDN